LSGDREEILCGTDLVTDIVSESSTEKQTRCLNAGQYLIV
jgi:hypothetical protein